MMAGLGLMCPDQPPHSQVLSRVLHLDIEECSEKLLRQQSYAIKNSSSRPKPPTWGSFGAFFLLLAGSLWHKIAGASNTLELSTNES